ncbi:MAG: rhodanese-like domain-containing protein [Microbacteriaceae bacterium]
MTLGGPDVEHISAVEAVELMGVESGAAGSLLVDVREQWEWDAGHAPLATHLPMSQLEQRHSELDTEATLLVICHSGQRSLSVTDALSRAGYHAVNVDGGMIAWRAAGGAVVSDSSEQPHV